MKPKSNYFVWQGHTGLGTLAPSSDYDPILFEDCPAPTLSPHRPCIILLLRVKHIIGSAASTAPAFYSESIKDTLNITAISFQVTTPVVMSSDVHSVNNTSRETNRETKSDRQRERKHCQRESSSSSSSSDESFDRELSQLKESYARGRSRSPQPPILTVSCNISFEYFLRERQKEKTRLIVEINHRTINETLKWTKSS